jgi:glycosyltransferase involved in cell wall biosynthesis
MKVLLIHNFYKQYGGENNYVNSLQNLLAQHNIKVIPYYKYSNNIKESLYCKTKVALRMLNNPKYESELKRLLNTEKPDICHINNLYPLIPNNIYTILKEYKIPIVQTIHTYRLLCPKGFLYRNNKMCEICVKKKIKYPSILYRCYHNSVAASLFLLASNNQQKIQEIVEKVDMFIFPAKFTRDYHSQFLRINKKKLAVLPYFVTKPKQIFTTGKRNYYLFVGRLSEEKGILDLIKVFNEIKKQRLIVIGTGPLYKTASKNAANNIKFLGELTKENIYNYMRNAIATIIPSPWYEVGPIVLMESFANNTTVIAPKIGVFRERINNNYNGFLYKPGNARDLKSKIIQLSKGALYKNRLKEIMHNEFKKKYSPEMHIKKLLVLYAKVNKKTK